VTERESVTPAVATAPALVVDDSPALRALLSVALRRAGIETIEAESARAAIGIIESRSISVVVCDVAMPGMSGIELVRELRRRSQTLTLPVILVTGSGDANTVIEGLEAGADDFLPKPVRLDELVARVRAHMRTQEVWSTLVQDELRVRSAVVGALGSLQLSSVPEETAEAVVAELAERTDSDFVSVAEITIDDRMNELATYNRADGVRRGGDKFAGDLAAYLIRRIRSGPWAEEVSGLGPEPTRALRAARVSYVASAPIYFGSDLVGLLTIGLSGGAGQQAAGRARLLASAIDYAGVLGALAGGALSGRREAGASRERLNRILEEEAFHIAFQPIVEVETGGAIGYEALARFDDGMRPDLRFAEAARADLGAQFELSTMAKAVSEAARLPEGRLVSVNVSPATVIKRADQVGEILHRVRRRVVLELTEHVPIDDYDVLRAAIARLGPDVEVAVDDAGAGYASLRHVLELRPAFAKLDVSLVRGIDTDEMRQALAAGMYYYALRTGCLLIAEGVETEAEAECLQRLGIDLAQGYLYGRPERIEG
jgi:EAL domain-containing protein (putative c-di-GMP-specific phosphodiesterase class I)/DNA-binding response OmpR family regulator